VPSSTIQAANDAVEKVINNDSVIHLAAESRGIMPFILKLPLVIMPSKHSKHFPAKHPALKWSSTVNDWKKEIINTTESHKKKLTR